MAVNGSAGSGPVWLRRLAGASPVGVFVALGRGGDSVLADLRVSRKIDVVASPRHAQVLVVAGEVPETVHDALRAVHDQVPGPRATVVVGADSDAVGSADAVGLAGRAVAVDRRNLMAELQTLQQRLLAGAVDDPPLGPADNPVAWQGVGPHGQGGEGMMGGVPWGRPMAMPPVEGRDGLALDRLSLTLGPFLAGLPPLLSLEVGLQGDVIETAAVHVAHGPAARADDPTMRVDLPAGRAHGLLAAMTELLVLAGLPAVARRSARLATAATVTATDVASLARLVDRPWGLRAATDGVGRVELPGRLGGDVTARWRRWLERIAALVEGAAGRDDAEARLDDGIVAALGEQLVGMEVGNAILTVASLRPELMAVAPAEAAP